MLSKIELLIIDFDIFLLNNLINLLKKIGNLNTFI